MSKEANFIFKISHLAVSMVLKWCLSFRFTLESIFVDLQMTDKTL